MPPNQVIDLTGSPIFTPQLRPRTNEEAWLSIGRDVCYILEYDFGAWPINESPAQFELRDNKDVIGAVKLLFWHDRENLESYIASTKQKALYETKDVELQLLDMKAAYLRKRSLRRSGMTVTNKRRSSARISIKVEANETVLAKATAGVQVDKSPTDQSSTFQSSTTASAENVLGKLLENNDSGRPAKKRRTGDSSVFGSSIFDASIFDQIEANSQAAEDQLLRESQQAVDTGAQQTEDEMSVDWAVRDLPDLGFGVDHEDLYFNRDIGLAWELLRAKQAFPRHAADIDKIYTFEVLSRKIREWSTMNDHIVFDPNEQASVHNRPVLSASLFSSGRRNANLLKFSLNPIKQDKSCRLSRYHGWERFIYVDVDLRNKIPQHLRNAKSGKQIQKAFLEWLLKDKQLFGREWRAFHLDHHKPSSAKSKDYQLRVVLFATDGPRLVRTTLRQLIDFILPFQHNAEQPACKAYSRIDLLLSRTKAVFQFRPDQIHLVPDLMSSGQDHDPYLDQAYRATHRRVKSPSVEVMSDGCARISVGAAKKIIEELGLVYRPSLFQARIAGAKGVWCISADYDTTDPYHQDVWIEIRESQLKVKHRSGAHTGLFSDGLADKFKKDLTLCSFDIVKHNAPPRAAELHRDFLHVIEDRGVPRPAILQMAEDDILKETDRWIQALDDPAACTRLVQQHVKDAVVQADEEALSAGAAERLQYFMRNGGFMPKDSRFLADEFIRLFAADKARSIEAFRIPCGKTTQLIGIADPTQTLPAGQVHIRLSRAPSGGDDDSHVTLAGRSILVARDPTLRQSDIQKMDVVDWPALAHLTDCIVFSSQGSTPAASKLQGGDYDGDIFWICWEPEMLRDFKNAPVLVAKPFKELGIRQDSKKLKDFLGVGRMTPTNKFADRFFEHNFRIKLGQDYLGIVTNRFYALAHETGDLDSAKAMDLVDLHDYLIDAAKNGYIFDPQFLVSNGLSNVPEPTYKTDIKKLRDDLDGSDADKIVNFELRSNKSDYENTHILHDLFYDILFHAAQIDVAKLKALLEGVCVCDDELTFTMKSLRSQHKQVCSDIEKAIFPQLDKVINSWNQLKSSRKALTARIAAVVAEYKRIECPAVSDFFLTFKVGPAAYTPWDYIKASMLASRCRNPKAVFTLAKGELCYLKSVSPSGGKTLALVSQCLRAQRAKVKAVNGDALMISFVAGSDSETGDEGEDDYGSVFDIEDLRGL